MRFLQLIALTWNKKLESIHLWSGIRSTVSALTKKNRERLYSNVSLLSIYRENMTTPSKGITSGICGNCS